MGQTNSSEELLRKALNQTAPEGVDDSGELNIENKEAKKTSGDEEYLANEENGELTTIPAGKEKYYGL